MLSDFLYVAPHDKIVKLLLQWDVPIYLYVQNTTVETFKLPEWSKAYHNIEQIFLIGAPFLDMGECHIFLFYSYVIQIHVYIYIFIGSFGFDTYSV